MKIEFVNEINYFSMSGVCSIDIFMTFSQFTCFNLHCKLCGRWHGLTCALLPDRKVICAPLPDRNLSRIYS